MFAKLIKAQPKDNYQIDVAFEDGVSGTLDLTPSSPTSRYSLFKDKEYFNTAHIQNNAIIRDENIDICGDHIYIQCTGKNPFI